MSRTATEIDTPERLAMAEAMKAVERLIAQSKNPRTTMGKHRPRAVAFHVAFAAVTTYIEAAAHERARRSSGVDAICKQCGRPAASRAEWTGVESEH